MAVGGQQLVAPATSRVLRPAPADQQRLLRLYGHAGRLAERNLDRIGHKQVAHGLEQDLISALISCLTTRNELPAPIRDQARISVQFEAVLAEHNYQILRMRELCDAIGTTGRILRASCARQLGMSPSRYQRLRRLKAVRTELLRRPAAADGVEVVMRYGFVDLHRFVAEYWRAYGEMPPIPPNGIEN